MRTILNIRFDGLQEGRAQGQNRIPLQILYYIIFQNLKLIIIINYRCINGICQ